MISGQHATILQSMNFIDCIFIEDLAIMCKKVKICFYVAKNSKVNFRYPSNALQFPNNLLICYPSNLLSVTLATP